MSVTARVSPSSEFDQPAGADRRPVLEIQDLSIAYRAADGDVTAVRGVDLALQAGRITGLAGESGCGKSTLAYGAVRLLRPPAVITGGQVTYRGRRIAGGELDVLAADRARLRELRWREIAIVFQSAMNALNPVARIGEQIRDALSAHPEATTQDPRERVAELLEMVGIPRARIRAYPHELSGGMRQRVMIAMALACDPEVVIMDEPTTGLDVVVQRRILQEMIELKAELGFAVLFITHDLSLLLEVADEVVVMYAGQVVESAPVEAVRRGGSHPYTRGLLNSFPRLRGPRVALSGIPGSPPSLRDPLPGCPFAPRCPQARAACDSVEMALVALPGGDADHRTACPFVTDDASPAAMAPASSPAAVSPIAPAGPVSAAAALDDATDVRARTADPDGAPVLEAVGLVKDFRASRRSPVVHAVKDVSLQLHRGRVVALVGESGSGKSTTAQLLAGQERPTAGRILLDGELVKPSSNRFREYKRDVQMVFQDPFASLNPLHTVRYHLQRALTIHSPKTGRRAGPQEVDRLLTQVRLSPAAMFRDAYPYELSGGQRQRVSIARALAAEPQVLLADEPVSMLDVSIRLEILDLIADLRSRMQLAILYITHDIASARYFADEILVMHAGQIVERGPAEQVVSAPAHEYTRTLIDASPDPDTFAAAKARASDASTGAATSAPGPKEGRAASA